MVSEYGDEESFDVHPETYIQEMFLVNPDHQRLDLFVYCDIYCPWTMLQLSDIKAIPDPNLVCRMIHVQFIRFISDISYVKYHPHSSLL